MAHSTVKTTKIIQLELSEDEAEWLKATIQNPTHPDESNEDNRKRSEIFNALKLALLK